jgi:hypothetical protein
LFFLPGDDRVHADTVTTDGDASKIRTHMSTNRLVGEPSVEP